MHRLATCCKSGAITGCVALHDISRTAKMSIVHDVQQLLFAAGTRQRCSLVSAWTTFDSADRDLLICLPSSRVRPSAAVCRQAHPQLSGSPFRFERCLASSKICKTQPSKL